ncbi:MAG: hypothetical protein ABIH56_05575 [Candidatus Margulisiibacteriota bacterium]
MLKRGLMIGLVSLALISAVAAVPSKMNFQGRLTDSGGNPITSAVEVVFSIYDASSGGTVLWTETISGITPDQGLINQELGLATPITSGIFSGDTRYLAIKVGTDAEMTPGIPLATVPFAFRAAVADSIVAGQVITSLASTGATPLRDAVTLSGGSGISLIQAGQDIQITAVSTAGGTVTQVDTGSGLTGGPINTTGTVSIAAGGINATHLGTGVVTDGAIANDTISEPKIHVMNDPVNSYLLTYTATGLAWGAAGGTGTVTQIDTGSGLTGGPINTTGTVSIAAGGINATHLGTGIVTAGAIASNAVITAGISDGAVTAVKIGTGQVVTSLASTGATALHDAVTLSSGAGISLNQVGQNIQITAVSTAGGTVTQVNTQAPLLGGPITTTGTISMPAASGGADGYLTSGDWTTFNNKLDSADLSGYVQLGPTTQQSTTAAYAIRVKTTNASGIGVSAETTASAGYGIYGRNNSTSDGGTGGFFKGGTISFAGVKSIGAKGESGSGNNYGEIGREPPSGIEGDDAFYAGVYGFSSSTAGRGVSGKADGSSGMGVYALAQDASGTNYGLRAKTNSSNGYAVYGEGGRTYFQGNTGIGTDNPGEKLSVVGTIEITSGSGGGLKFADGTIQTTAATGGSTPDLSGYVQLGPTTQQSTTAAYAINVKSTHASGVAISAEVNAATGRAISGINSYSTGGMGGYFRSGQVSDGTLAIGVRGEIPGGTTYGELAHFINIVDSGTTKTGVYGYTSDSGSGVYGNGDRYGVKGLARNSTGIGVDGVADSTTGVNYGGYFTSASDAGYAIFANAQSGSGVNYALFGQTNSAAGYALYAQGGMNCLWNDTGIGTDNPQALLHVAGDCIVDGTLSKGGGSFDIVHPDPAKASQGYRLRHSFVESPTRGDNLYRWVATVEGGSARIILPDYFKFLNENVQVWVSPKKHFGQAYGEANGALTEIEITANVDGQYNVLAVGTRKDKLVKDWFDPKGVEYIKTEEDPVPPPEIE